jgi:hypothetical protein
MDRRRMCGTVAKFKLAAGRYGTPAVGVTRNPGNSAMSPRPDDGTSAPEGAVPACTKESVQERVVGWKSG